MSKEDFFKPEFLQPNFFNLSISDVDNLLIFLSISLLLGDTVGVALGFCFILTTALLRLPLKTNLLTVDMVRSIFVSLIFFAKDS